MRPWGALAAALVLAIGGASPLRAAGGQHSEHVAFDRYAPLAASDEIVRRTLSPVAAERILGFLERKAQRLPEQSIDLAHERFTLYVPPGDPPAAGYGLLVFIAPWDEGGVPADWRKVLDRRGMIFVAAERSGNDANMLWRRLPLALHAQANVAARYRIDPARVVVSGFSGGSRTAMRAALSYPDVFRGAVLNAGADAFGDAGIAVPPPELFAQFRDRSRIVLVSGDDDAAVVARDAAMLDAADRLCVQGIGTQPMRRTGHALMKGLQLERALDAIEAPAAPSPSHADHLARCRAAVQAEVTKGLAEVRAKRAQGDRAGAGRALSQVDERYGGLAAPDSVELARQLLSK